MLNLMHTASLVLTLMDQRQLSMGKQIKQTMRGFVGAKETSRDGAQSRISPCSWPGILLLHYVPPILLF